jgi:hypothetical protein
MHIHRTPRALPRIGSALGTAFALLALSGAPAQAATGSSLTGEGLHISAGALVDPAKRTWVADHNGGFCRMTPATDDGPGHIEHPQHPGEPGTRTCLGGLLPDAAPGPDAAGQPVLVDPTPDWVGNGDEVALIPDGASPSSEVVRAQWNPNTKLFEYRDTISMIADRGRPTVLSLGADDAVYVGFQRETTIQRIVDPAAARPQVEVVGTTTDGRAAQVLAAGRDANGDSVVYVSETTGVRVLRPDSGNTRTEAAPFDVDALTAIGSMFYDLETDHLYIGTANAADQVDGAGVDTLMQIDTRTNFVDPAYATGYTMVGGIAKALDGNLIVLDDPALITPEEPIGTGRMYHVGLPAAHVVAGALDDDGRSGRDNHTADVTPSFAIAGDGAVECRLYGAGRDTGWEACAEDTPTYTVERELEDGTYTLSVRAIQGEIVGKPEAFRFTVDTDAPLPPEVKRPAAGSTVSLTPWLEFASEDHAKYQCAFDEGAFEDCDTGRTHRFADAEVTEHVLQLVAIDRAGNRSEPTAARFSVDPTLDAEPSSTWTDEAPTHKGSSLFSRGLHVSTGAIVDPNGRTWVADHNGGFCRVTEPTDEDGAGTIDHPSVPGDAGPRTCLGGLLPEAGPGPDAAGRPVFVDPSPEKPGNGDEMALIPDGASPSSDVVRARWNPENGLFEYVDIVPLIGDRVRPVAAAAGPDGAVYLVFQRSGTVQRIGNPAGDRPTVDVVGRVANGRRAEAIAVGRDAEGRPLVLIGEDTGITQLVPNAATPPLAEPSRFDVDPGVWTVSAMAYDLERNVLYVGTANGTVEGADVVHRFDAVSGEAELGWVKGYSMIGGLAVRPGGALYVLDDPALLDPAEPLGLGRMYHIGRPAAHIAADSKAFVNDPRPAFDVSGEETVECRLRGEGIDTGFVACATDAPWQPTVDLADGRYVLAVRSVQFPQEDPNAETPVDVTKPIAVGLVETHAFTVDTVRPDRPTITSPGNGAKVGAAPWFTFDAEALATFECRWDTETAFTACEPGRTKTFDQNADHTLVIKAIDRAGNPSEQSAPVTFSARGFIESIELTGPEGATNNNSPVFTFSSDAVKAQFACRLNNRTFTACVDEKAYTNLADGAYAFEVQGMDEFGNVSVAHREFRVDTTKPRVTAPTFAEGSVTGDAVTFGLSVSEAATLTCTLDGNTFTNGCGTTIQLTGLRAGERVLIVNARDAAGNVGTFTRYFWVEGPAEPVAEETVEPDAPAVTLVAPARIVPVTPARAARPAQPAQSATPSEPTVTVIDQATNGPLTVRLADIDRRVDLARIQEAGVTVQVIPAQGTKLIRFRVIKVSGNGRNRGGRAVAASAGRGRKVVATIYRRVKPGRNTITLTRRELRRVTAGRYVLEVTPGASRTKLGKAKSARFQVTR